MKYIALMFLLISFSTQKTMKFGIDSIEELGNTPSFEEGSKPQGIVMLSDSTFLVSVHHNDTKSTIYEVRKDNQIVINEFDMPADATHTSGLTIVDSVLLAVDYNSNKLYVLDLKKSLEHKLPVIINDYKTGLKGSSAITSFNWQSKTYLAISDFMNSKATYIFDFNKLSEKGNLSQCKVAQYNNGWFSQGIGFSNGIIYESRNSAFGKAYIELRNISDILNGNQVKVTKLRTTLKGIEDIDFDGEYWWTTDEVSYKYYRIKINND